jgi:uncharacterized membrane protein YhaH (DUF805 family)
MDWANLFLRFDGRISRKPFWVAFCLLFAATLLSILIVEYIGGERIVDIVNLALLYPEFAVIIKRAHDRETPRWILALYFFLDIISNVLAVFGFYDSADDPFAAVWITFFMWLLVGLSLLFELGFRRGVRGPNRYGPDPLERQT